jgi:ABC-2 type transport system ATP-binding protein
MRMNLAIETEVLSKHYGKIAAVEDLNLRVTEGEIYAFLGLNGAGKTTTIRMLLGMIRPSAGQAAVLNTRIFPGRSEPWARVGYLVETPHAYPELSVYENLEVTRRLHPGTPSAAVDRIIQRLDLTPYAYRPAGTLSLGNAQRLGLAKALLHNPSLLILDEPANGLDPAGIVEIRELLLELTRQGCTVFMSSHILGEVARLAQRIGIIHQGRLLQELNIDQLEKNRIRRLVVRANEPHAACACLADAGFYPVLQADGGLELKEPAAILHPDVIATLMVQAGCAPTQLLVEEEDLEQYFLRLIGADGVKNHE